MNEQIEKTDVKTPKATRKDIHLPRRLFHLTMGVGSGTIYALFLTHNQAVYILGTCACLLYIFEQVRLNYPEYSGTLSRVTKYFLRAEEQLKESASIPFVMGLLLTILTFPKSVSLVAIYTLAISDPLSAIIGIKFGRTRIVPHKSLEGSLAFFLSCFCIICFVYSPYLETKSWTLLFVAFAVSFSVSVFEMLPIKLDDNLTIPIFSAVTMWLAQTLLLL
ncbi:SEC59/DGK1/VTE5 family protein [Halobacteriovorax sp. GB3]|uniref:diacylglycerol/polyprenol kinase family protein n=1 Tax=Halobacteriovorax sp. GB3 TaxID=2719615 RepID=UPI0023604918|nr:diacylglycerol/polyprenol kinase family protein [Halobacteriovorax sp. GB3]MDD0853408.1 SEC59/DGK1/VTE5 family protein [Halobacteriovorax sp. GB3]